MLEKKLLSEIIKTIIDYKKPEKIILFGSRASGEYKKVSDIDIAIFAGDWTDKDINLVKNKLDEYVKTPLKFDVVNFYALKKDNLKKNILEKGEIIYDFRKD